MQNTMIHSVASILILVVTGCGSKVPTPAEESAGQQSAVPASPGDSMAPTQPPARASGIHATGASIFANPGRVCDVLSTAGLPSSPRGWAKAPVGKYTYLSFLKFPPGNDRLDYTLDSASADRVETISLSAAVFDLQKESEILGKFQELTEAFFTGLGLPVPEGLLNAVERRAAFSIPLEYGEITLKKESHFGNSGFTLSWEMSVAPSPK